MKDNIFTVTFHNIELEVYGHINPGESGDREQPPIAPSVDINKVTFKKIDVSDLLDVFSNDWQEKIITEIIENQ